MNEIRPVLQSVFEILVINCTSSEFTEYSFFFSPRGVGSWISPLTFCLVSDYLRNRKVSSNYVLYGFKHFYFYYPSTKYRA